MTWFTGAAAFVAIWFVVLFGVLPWGVRQTETPQPGHEPGAPERPRLFMKVAVTTAVALAAWGALYGVIESGIIEFRD